MRWKGRRGSENVEDRRGVPAGPVAIGGVGLIIMLAVMFLGGDPSQVADVIAPGGEGGTAGEYTPTPEEEEQAAMVKVVLADTEEVWTELFRDMGRTYEKPPMVLFSGAVKSACGFANAAVGPFYCPADQKVYIDLAFFRQLKERFGAPGDFAQAYVIAHEVGHHVQNLMGWSDILDRARQRRADERTINALSVRLELQADFLAGVWAHHAQRKYALLEEGDLEEALRAATAIGDDAIQRQTQGHVVPDAFTHGSSAQRLTWFRHGFATGDVKQGNTFDDDHFRRIDPDAR